MGAAPSAPVLPLYEGSLVHVPLPERLDDAQHLDADQLLNVLRLVLLLTDPKTAERNAPSQDRARALNKQAPEQISVITPLDAFLTPLWVVSNQPVWTTGAPSNGTERPDFGTGVSSLMVTRRALRIVRPLDELRDVVRWLQDEQRASSSLSLCGCVPSRRVTPHVPELQSAMRARAEVLLWRAVPLLRTTTVVLAATGDARRVALGMLTDMGQFRVRRFMRLFNDIDLLSKGFTDLRDLARDVSVLASEAAPRSALFPLVLQFSYPRVPGQLRYDEFLWTIHNLCICTDADLVQMAYAFLSGTGEYDARPCIDLDLFDHQNPGLLVPSAPPDDVALRKAVLELRRRRKAALDPEQYAQFGHWFTLADFVHWCKATPNAIMGLRTARRFFRRRTFGEAFWERRQRDLAVAIANGNTFRSPAAEVPDHPAVRMRLPLLRPLVQAQAALRPIPHASDSSRRVFHLFPLVLSPDDILRVVHHVGGVDSS